MLSDTQQRVNQRLYHFRLNQRLRVEANGPANSAALAESLIFHLKLVYQNYLQELAELYRVVLDSRSFRAVDLQRALGSMAAGEVSELVILECGSGWLSELVTAWTQCEQGLSDAGSSRGKGEIALVDLSSVSVLPDLSAVIHAGEQMELLINTQRSHFDEW